MEAKRTVYLETTIPSYLAARPSRDLVIAGNQAITNEWWAVRRNQYQLYISKLVYSEATKGDPDAVARRVQLLEGLEYLQMDDAALNLTEQLIQTGLFPEKAHVDAGHVAIAARHNIDFLLTWNCTHIANADIRKRLSYHVQIAGFKLPHICIPNELFGEDYPCKTP